MRPDNVGSIEYQSGIDLAGLRKDGKEVDRIAHQAGKDLEDGVGGGADNAEVRASAALNRLKNVMKATAIAAGAVLAGGIAAAAKASYDQVDAVQQATVGLNAYEKDADKVSSVLKGLLGYAQSDLGVLFNRKDLYASAQSLKIMGDNTDELVGHVQILSRSVGLGLSNWDDLNLIIGRVGSTGRLTGEDFDNLTKAGFKLDPALRNTNTTFQELFKQLDRGIPTNALEGQANTIKGQGIRLETAFRNVGNAILGVDKDTNLFIEGGLGDTFVRGTKRATQLLKDLQPAAAAFGRGLSATISVVSDAAHQISGFSNILLVAGAGFVTYNGIMITVTTTTKAMAAAQLLFNNALKLNPIALAAAAAVGIVSAYINVVTQTDNSTNASNRLKAAQDALKLSTDANRAAQDALKNALLGQEGAALRVEQAQLAYNSAVAQYGPQSLQARQAAYDLKVANDQLANSNREVANSTKAANDAQNQQAKDAANVQARLRETANSAAQAAGGYVALANAIANARAEDAKTGVLGQGKNTTNAILGIGQRAGGGPVSANKPYFVGENSDGSLNNTSELFVPRSSGSIVNSKDLQEALGGGGNGLTNNIQAIYINNKADADYLLSRLTRETEIYDNGSTPVRKFA